MSYLGSNLKEKMVLNIASWTGSFFSHCELW